VLFSGDGVGNGQNVPRSILPPCGATTAIPDVPNRRWMR
jgi:hypothetical protein